MKKKIFSEYKKGFNYIKDSWKHITIVIGFFVLFFMVGYFISAPDYISNQIMDYLNQLIKETEGFGFWDMFLFIFFNNFKSSFFGLFAGIFFGVFSIFTSLSNGYMLGFMSNFVSSQGGGVVLWRLLPHGIFELPAVFISLGIGLKLGSFFLKKEKLKFVKENLKSSLRVFVMIVVPLLLIAGLIESVLIVFG